MRTPTDPKKLIKALQTGRRKLGMKDEAPKQGAKL